MSKTMDELQTAMSKSLEYYEVVLNDRESLSVRFIKKHLVVPMLGALGFKDRICSAHREDYGRRADCVLMCGERPFVYVHVCTLVVEMDNEVRDVLRSVPEIGGIRAGILTNGYDYRFYSFDESGALCEAAGMRMKLDRLDILSWLNWREKLASLKAGYRENMEMLRDNMIYVQDAISGQIAAPSEADGDFIGYIFKCAGRNGMSPNIVLDRQVRRIIGGLVFSNLVSTGLNRAVVTNILMWLSGRTDEWDDGEEWKEQEEFEGTFELDPDDEFDLADASEAAGEFDDECRAIEEKYNAMDERRDIDESIGNDAWDEWKGAEWAECGDEAGCGESECGDEVPDSGSKDTLIECIGTLMRDDPVLFRKVCRVLADRS